MSFAAGEVPRASLIVYMPGDAPSSDDNLVLLLPGLSGNQRQWDFVAAGLRSAGVPIAYGAPILPHPAFGGRRPTLLELARAMSDELADRPDRSVVLVSHSVGAFVALAMAYQLSEKVVAVVTVNGGLTTVARFIDAPLRQLLRHPRECAGFLRLFVLVTTPVPRRVKRLIASREWTTRLFVGNLVSDQALDTPQQRTALVAEAGRFETLKALVENRHYWREYERTASTISAPVVFVVGDRDPMTSLADTETMAAMLPSSEIVVLPGVGHAAPIEAASRVVAEIRRRFASVQRMA